MPRSQKRAWLWNGRDTHLNIEQKWAKCVWRCLITAFQTCVSFCAFGGIWSATVSHPPFRKRKKGSHPVYLAPVKLAGSTCHRQSQEQKEQRFQAASLWDLLTQINAIIFNLYQSFIWILPSVWITPLPRWKTWVCRLARLGLLGACRWYNSVRLMIALCAAQRADHTDTWDSWAANPSESWFRLFAVDFEFHGPKALNISEVGKNTCWRLRTAAPAMYLFTGSLHLSVNLSATVLAHVSVHRLKRQSSFVTVLQHCANAKEKSSDKTYAETQCWRRLLWCLMPSEGAWLGVISCWKPRVSNTFCTHSKSS